MFCITINGVPDKDSCDKFWRDIEKYHVNFIVLEKHCYIYGNADEHAIDDIIKKAERFGLNLIVERG